MEFLERDDLLTRLWGLFETARTGTGCLVFVGGEAGAGKTTLSRAHAKEVGTGIHLLWGACEPLDPPPPFGALHDMVSHSDAVSVLLQSGNSRHEVFAEFLELLSTPSLMVVDDAHWADDATLDLLRYVGRRVTDSRSQVLVCYREDELGLSHPLRALLGDLSTADGCLRLEVPLLSRNAVVDVAASEGVDGERLYRITRGNPFFVTEVLAHEGEIVPNTIADAVLARLRRLSDGARAAVETLSVAPSPLDWDLVFCLGDIIAEAVPEAVAGGFLEEVDGRVRFRHELARQAVVETLPEPRKRDCHRLFLDLLQGSHNIPPALIAHHADGAGDSAAAISWSRSAAKIASEAGAHRQAAGHLHRSRLHAERAAPHLVSDLLEAEADERHTYDDPNTVVSLRRRVLDLRRSKKDRRGEGVALARLANAVWRTGPASEATEAARDAVAAVKQLHPDSDVAEIVVTRAFHASLRYDRDEALIWAERARQLAEELELPRIRAMALVVLGIVRLRHDEDPKGADYLEAAHRLARRNGDDLNAMRTRLNLGATWYALRDYQKAEQALKRVFTYCSDRDLDTYADYAKAIVAHIRFERGRWVESEDLASEVRSRAPYDSLASVLARTAVARVGVRRGRDEAAEQLASAQSEAERNGDIHRLWSVAGGRAEAAWLSGDIEAVRQIAEQAHDDIRRLDPRWLTGELVFWQWRSGASVQFDDSVVPYGSHVKGDFERSADAWAELGRPYEQAEALADTDNESQLRKALGILDELGARPRGDRLRTKMRRLGITDLPARPRHLYRTESALLTSRQTEVLALMEQGASNAEIADRLFISEKTAANHVSAILTALGAQNRTEAVHVARKAGVEKRPE